MRLILILVGLSCFALSACSMPKKAGPGSTLYYLEIVCKDVAAQCESLEKVHGLSFGPEDPDMGQARIAKFPDGSQVGVRKPLAAHEQPIVRTYLVVKDMEKAVQVAEKAGAVIAYPPTKQGDTGTWAIYILDGIQHGLWQW